ncbi:chemotaxis protein CheA [Aeromonas veronii]|uniref:chemotaxis protein CheA n=1 Tax=Aeromonas veronii TaxID=654 RepID=UPI0005A88707|nr:chemotaxis protein CheA [Aeromonas veronii]MBS4692173.1 chemotaxis protein CheA [Aeromonas veronii bv. veronii]OKP36993.1 chemotaxis protein CheA [Aeromonas veronii bv. veronii]
MDINKARMLFFEEAYEQCDNLEQALLDRIRHPLGADTYNQMFRTAHTIKGSASMLGLELLVRFTHSMENILARLRSGDLDLDEPLTQLLLHCNDQLRDLLQSAEHNPELKQVETQQILALMSQMQGFQSLPSMTMADRSVMPEKEPAVPIVSEHWHLSVRFYSGLFRDGFDVLALLKYLGKQGTIHYIMPVWHPLPPLQLLDGTDCFLGYEIVIESACGVEKLRSAFDFVASQSVITLLPVHGDLALYRAAAPALCAWQDEDVSAQYARWERAGSLTSADIQVLLQPAPLTAPSTTTQLVTDTPEPVSSSRKNLIRSDSHYIRIDAAKLDQLINRVGELVIAASATTLQAHQAGNVEMIESVAVVNGLVEGIRDDALTLRMVPIHEIFNRFPRVVHELSLQTGKSVTLNIQNADTDIDKSMVEKLTDPLLHLVRNAIDHGIEPPAVRREKGKPEQGNITLNAYHDAGAVVVEVNDDGDGISREKVLAKALQAGLVSDTKAMSDNDVYQLLFAPGFSTNSEVNELSGRGVGLDVVRRNLDALRGDVTVESKQGVGTTFRLRLPLTLAIIDGFRVQVADTAFVIPLEMMTECLELPDSEEDLTVQQLHLRGEWLPYVHLRALFGLPPAQSNEFVVVVHHGDRRAGLVVDHLIGELQTVIKPLGELFRPLRGISGSTILGNGHPALILDIPQLLAQVTQWEQQRILHTLNEGHFSAPCRHAEGI